MTQPLFKKIVIFGVGLIGGSFALALRKAHAVDSVVGFGRSAATLQQAQQLGIIDRIGQDVAAEVGDADLVLLATPVGQMAELMARIAPHLGAHTLITDGGSTKSDVVRDAYAQLGSKVAQFVPAHPIAGDEQSGPPAARAGLYLGKKVVLTPLPENTPQATCRICCRSRWRMTWRSATTASCYCLSPPAASGIPRALRRVHRKCGAIFAWQIAKPY